MKSASARQSPLHLDESKTAGVNQCCLSWQGTVTRFSTTARVWLIGAVYNHTLLPVNTSGRWSTY